MEPKSVKVLKGIIQLLISFGIHTILALITKCASSASVLLLKAFPLCCAGGWRREVALHVVNLDTSRAPLSVLVLATLITELVFAFVFFNVFDQNWNSPNL